MIHNLCLKIQEQQPNSVYFLYKSQRITPIYNNGLQYNVVVANCRSIILTSEILKAFDSIMFNKSKALLTDIISKKQHGFVNRRS